MGQWEGGRDQPWIGNRQPYVCAAGAVCVIEPRGKSAAKEW
jgi:hypothetical protein